MILSLILLELYCSSEFLLYIKLIEKKMLKHIFLKNNENLRTQ